jgi:hypothetical protein
MSIYHLLWYYGFLEEEGAIFRGQRDSRWRQDTTLLRPRADCASLTIGELQERLSKTQAFLDALSASEVDIFGRSLPEEERMAIAQHYGFPTPLLDYTRSLAIAAFFATGSGDPSCLRQGDIGVIYYLNERDGISRPHGPKRADGVDLARALGLQLGRLRVIEPHLPDPNRIARQQGLFVEGFVSKDLERVAGHVLYFEQQPGEAYEDPCSGVTRLHLLEADPKLAVLVDSVISSPPKYSFQLASISIPDSDILGSIGMHLMGNLYHGQDFLDRLAAEADLVEPGLWCKLKAIIESYFKEASIAARTVNIAGPQELKTKPGGFAPIGYVLDEVDAVLTELARLADLQPDTFMRLLREHRPHALTGRPEIAGSVVDDLRLRSPKAKLGFAASIFVVALEH